MLGRLGLFALAAAAALALASCGGGDGDSSPRYVPVSCEEVNAPSEANVSCPSRSVRRGERITALVKTSEGSFTIALDTRDSPATVGSFVHLVNQHFYDGLTFHRVVPDFVIQGGDPQGNGTGGPGYFVDEPPPDDTTYTRGTVAMAKTQAEPPGRSGSQFFVVLPPDAGLPAVYALLGKVSSGMAAVDRIAALGDAGSPTGEPTSKVVIEKITIPGG